MAERRAINISFFYGGLSDSQYFGPEGTFAEGSYNLDILTDPGSFTAALAPTLDSSTTVIDLPKWIVSGQPYTESVFAYGSGGQLYERSSGVWSIIRSVTASQGNGLAVLDDYLYYARNNTVGRYGPLSGSPTFDDTWQTSGINSTTDTGWMPLLAYEESLAVGHGNNLGWWDGSVWDPDRLTVAVGRNIRTLSTIDEFITIGAWSGTSVTDVDRGIVYFWDTTSVSVNFLQDMQDGAINALLNSRNRQLTVIGSKGAIYLGSRPYQKVKLLPGVGENFVEIYPGAVGNWRNVSLIGVSGNTDSDILQGVYTWGSKSDRLTEGLNLTHTISPGVRTGTNLFIGAVAGMGDECYIGWRNGGDFGIDRIDSSSTKQTEARYRSLYFDDDRPGFQKMALTLKAVHRPLAANESVQLSFRTDGATSFTSGTANTTVGSTETRYSVPGASAKFSKIQLQVDIAGAGTAPTIEDVAMLYDPMTDSVGTF